MVNHLTQSGNTFHRYRQFLLVFLMTVLGGGANYLFQIIVSRNLGPADFSEFAVIFGLMAVITTAGSAFQATTAKSIATSALQTASGWRDEFTRHVFRIATVVLLLLVAMSPLLGISLGLRARLLLPVALFVYAAFGESIASGRLQGLKRFNLLATFSLAQSLGKVVAALVAAAVGWRTFGVLMTVVLVATGITALEFFSTRRQAQATMTTLDPSTRRHLGGLIIFWAIQTVDVQIARFAFDPMVAGQYAACAQLGKVTLVIPLLVTQLSFPDLAGLDSTNAQLVHRRATLEIILLGASLAAVLAFAHKPAVQLLLGNQYLPYSHVVWKIALMSIVFGLANLELYVAVAQDSISRPVLLAISLLLSMSLGITSVTSVDNLVALMALLSLLTLLSCRALSGSRSATV